jgi:hypothetical protein
MSSLFASSRSSNSVGARAVGAGENEKDIGVSAEKVDAQSNSYLVSDTNPGELTFEEGTMLKCSVFRR